MDAAPVRNPWDQLPDEPDEAYARFLMYRNLGPGRSHQLAYETYLRSFQNSVPNEGKSRKKPQVPGHWQQDSTRHSWVDRAYSWDVHSLRAYGEQMSVKWLGILSTAIDRVAEKLADPKCKPRDFAQCVAVMDKVAAFLTPEAVRATQPAPDATRKRPEPARADVE